MSFARRIARKIQHGREAGVRVDAARDPPGPVIEPRLDDPFSDYKMAGA